MKKLFDFEVLAAMLILGIALSPLGAQNGKNDPKVIFPELPTPPQPKPPAPTPGQPINLTSEMLYVVRSGLKCVMVTSPPGIIRVNADAGPLRIRAKFIESPGEWQTKNYTEKYIYTIEAVAVGKAELIVVPEGGGDGDVIRKQFDVTVAPRPPPDPIPDPPVPDDVLVKALKAAYALDFDKDKATQADSFAGLYNVVATRVKSGKYATSQEVQAAVKAAEPDLGITPAAVPNLRKAIGVYLNPILPKSPTAPLTQADRDLVYTQFSRVAAALGGLR